MKRVFIAIEIRPEPEVTDVIDLLRNELHNERIRWVNEQHFHLTLKFFGDQSEKQIADIIRQTENVCRQTASFSFSIGKPCYFRDRNQLRILWLKILQSSKLENLQQTLEQELDLAGIKKEDRRFQPHLTLGRIQSISEPRRFYELMNQFTHQALQVVTVNQLILFESILKPSGPEYRTLKTFTLQKNNG